MDRIKDKHVRGAARVGRLGDEVRQARLRGFGHVKKTDSENTGRQMLEMELPGQIK